MSALLLAKEAGPGFHIPEVTHLFTFRPFASFAVGGVEFRITYITVVMFGLSLLLFAVFAGAFASPKLVPRGLQNVVEAGVDLVRSQIAAPVLGPDADRWLPYLTALFFFVFSLNVMEIVPFWNFPITSRMAIPAVLSALTYLIFNVVGIAKNGFLRYMKANLFPPGVPKGIYVILTPIELASTFVFRPLTLAVRLFANMMAGHVLLTIVFLSSAYFLYRSTTLFFRPIGVITLILGLLVVVFVLMVGVIQAFIITMLTAVYIQGASHPEH